MLPLQEFHFGAEFRGEKAVRIQDLHFDLKCAVRAIGFRRYFVHSAFVMFVQVGLGTNATFLAQGNFREVRFVHINFDLEIF